MGISNWPCWQWGSENDTFHNAERHNKIARWCSVWFCLCCRGFANSSITKFGSECFAQAAIRPRIWPRCGLQGDLNKSSVQLSSAVSPALEGVNHHPERQLVRKKRMSILNKSEHIWAPYNSWHIWEANLPNLQHGPALELSFPCCATSYWDAPLESASPISSGSLSFRQNTSEIIRMQFIRMS